MSQEAPVLLLLLLKLIRSICDVIDDDRCLYCCRRLYAHTHIYIHLQFVTQTTIMIIHLIHLAIHHSSFQSHLDLYIYIYMYACVPFSDIYIYTLSRTLISTKLRMRRAIHIVLYKQQKRSKIEIQYLFDGLECLLAAKLSLYAFWQQSLLIDTEKKRVFFLACSLLRAK